MRFITTICIAIILILPEIIKASSPDTLFVAFWNLQNLFDTVDDPEKNDEDFLPDGNLEWTEERLDKKMYNLSRIIRMMNDGNGPDILGVCEVENEEVFESMVDNFLSDLDYEIAYIESPDNRGIDNGLIFKADKFELINMQADTVYLSDGWPTRSIFGVNLLTNDNKTLTVFVNHWPSRGGGQKESEPKRIEAALTLRNAVDRIFLTDENANIFIIGDFNDDPVDISLLEALKANPIKCDSIPLELELKSEKELFNLAYQPFENGEGSFKYRDTWNMLDQVIVSGSIITGIDFNYICNSFQVFKPKYIVTHLGKYEGTPFPTYGGKKYLGGYSDHFPVTAKFEIYRSNE